MHISKRLVCTVRVIKKKKPESFLCTPWAHMNPQCRISKIEEIILKRMNRSKAQTSNFGQKSRSNYADQMRKVLNLKTSV